MSLFAELRRRNVFRVGAAYAVVAWLLLQVADIMLENFGAPEWVFKTVAALLLLGFPVALVLAWAYELTPAGVVRTPTSGVPGSLPARSNWPDLVLALLLIAVVGVTVMDWLDRGDRDGIGMDTPVPSARPDSTDEALRGPASIAVLPFTNMSPDPDNAFFADGIAEELLLMLSRIDGLEVASRTSAFTFRDRDTSIPEIARQLGVAHILEGSVRREGGRVRVTAQLIDAVNDRHIWAESFDREFKDIFMLQAEIAQAITNALRGPLATTHVRFSVHGGDIGAYETFLRGRELFHQRGPALLEARRLLEHAVSKDPQLARAWAVLAAVYLVSPGYVELHEDEALRLARQAANRARELDDRLGLPYAVLARVTLTADASRLKAAELFEEAVTRDPADVTTRLWRGVHYLEVGHLETAEAEFAQALRMDPLSGAVQGWYGTVRGMRGDHAEAERLLTSAAEFGGWYSGYFRRVMIAVTDGDAEGAAMLLRRVIVQHPNVPIVRAAVLEDVARALLDPRERHRFLESAAAMPDSGRVGVAQYLMLGMYDEALEFEAGHSATSRTGLFEYAWWPIVRPLREHPDFLKLAERHGLVTYWEAKGYPDQCARVDHPQPHLLCGTKVKVPTP